jgi:predicted helicase
VGQVSENDNNKNRRYKVIDEHIRQTYVRDSKATKTKAYDAYVRFFRWATDRLQGRDGVVCYVSNNSFLDQTGFDGMRKHLAQDFNQIYHLDLHGNVRKNPSLSGTTHNVFGIQVGVGITVGVRNSANPERCLHYFRVPENWTRVEKLAFLNDKKNLGEIDWKLLQPDARQTWLTEGMQTDFETFLPVGAKESKVARSADVQTVFKTYSLGVSTNRDDVVYDFDRQRLEKRVELFIEDYNAEVSRWVRLGCPKDVDDFVNYEKLKWSRNLKRELRNQHYVQFNRDAVTQSIYRPFSRRWLYHEDIVVDEQGSTGSFFHRGTIASLLDL